VSIRPVGSRSGTLPAIPPVVYLPTTDEEEPAARGVLMHTVPDGRTALFVYSAIDRLFELYRDGNAWIVCDVATLQRIHDATPYDLLFVDRAPGPGGSALDGPARDEDR
jgi:hypothetical protein